MKAASSGYGDRDKLNSLYGHLNNEASTESIKILYGWFRFVSPLNLKIQQRCSISLQS